MITLFWYPRTRAARALWLLEEAGLDYTRVFVDIRNPSATDPRLKMASPMGKIPAIIDGDVMMADGAAIALYIADRYPDSGLAPPVDHPLRGRYLYWMTFAPGCIEPAMAQKFGGWETNPQAIGWGNFDIMIKTAEAGLAAGPWILGEQFSAADVMVGSSFNFIRTFGIMPDSDILNAYVDRCLERPAYQRALDIDAVAAAELEAPSSSDE